jgi:hypothetical protein
MTYPQPVQLGWKVPGYVGLHYQEEKISVLHLFFKHYKKVIAQIIFIF